MIPALIYVADKTFTAYQVYQDIEALRTNQKTWEQLAKEKGQDYMVQAIAGNIGKYGLKVVKQGGRKIVQSVKKTCSFHGDTLISTINGYKPISTIKIGDYVWSRDEYTGKYSYQPVTNWYFNQYQETVYVTIIDSKGNEQVIISNTIHPFFVKTSYGTITPPSSEGHHYQGEITNGAWVDASHLKAGDKLLSEDGSWQTIKSISITQKPLTAYNLSIDNTHTYFVSAQGGKYGVWVHNDCLGKYARYNSPEIKLTDKGLEHILKRHSADLYTTHSKGDLFPKGTTDKQIKDAIKSVYSNGARISNDNSPSHVFEKRIKINGKTANYRLVVNKKNK